MIKVAIGSEQRYRMDQKDHDRPRETSADCMPADSGSVYVVQDIQRMAHTMSELMAKYAKAAERPDDISDMPLGCS